MVLLCFAPGLLWPLVAGCTRERRHEVLVFFFDGVPPLNPVSEEPREVSPYYYGDGSDRGPITWTMKKHPPYEKGDCDTCHPDEKSNFMGFDFDRRGGCFTCHEHEPFEERIASEPFLHGPVAVLSCLVCHDPHESIHEGIVVRPDPKLCYQCHDRDIVLSKSAHQDLEVEACLPCHDPHGGPDRFFLREEETAQGATEVAEAASPSPR